MRGNLYSTLFPPVLLFCLTVVVIDSHDDSQRLCVHSEGDFVKQGNILPVGSLLDNNTTQICPKSTDFCFILWQEHPKNKSVVILHQGCWESTDVSCKHNECIALKKPSKARNYTKFCCCDGNFCNINITDGYLKEFDPPEPDFAPVDHMPYTMQIVIAAIVLIVCVMFAIITCFLTRIYCSTPKRSNESLHLMEAPPPMPSNFDLDTLKIQNALARGRYGTVYLGSLNDQSVAVKIFSYQNRQHFLNERDIYTLPHMNHASLPKYIGSEERTGEDGRPEYLLVVSFSPIGCLQDYLRENVIDWNQLCKMTLSITRGLAHLHTEFKSGDKFKPCIAHRDVTSRNIIVKPDGTCMLCDFGFAIRLCGSKYILNGEEQVAEETSLADVGTLRYMAPEILEGAVNLRDCESSLKQTDVYALGLVMWEIASRCSDLFQGVEVPPYKQPFEAEVGLDPTMEQMQSLVAKLKARPLFPDIWKGTNPAVRSLKETIEDCWDQDAEARLTTLCVKERLMELPVLWERYKAGLGIPGGISPTINSTVDLHESSNLQKKSCTDSDLGLDITDQDQLIIPRERTNSVSECTTETLLSPSDTNLKNILNSNDSSATKVSVPLQPHQGRNPCLARNLLQEQSDDLPVIGNVLHDDNSKYISDKRIYSFSDGDANIFSLPNGMQSSLLASSDRINHSNRVCNPIPYVQNHINFPSIIPKQPNIPANMGSKDLFKKDEKRWGPFRYFGRKTAKDSIRAGLKILLDRKTSMSNGYLPEEQQPLKNSSISSPISPSESNIKQGQINPVNSFWTCNEVRETDHTVSREVKISKPEGSVPLARPLNNNPEKVEGQENVLKNDSQLLNGYTVVIDDKENNHDVSPDFTTENKIKLGEREKSKRPTTLPVQSFNDDQDDEELLEISNMDISKESVNGQVVQQENTDNKTVPIRRKGSGNKRKGVKRVKTPFEIKGRFSLYDDRIMSSQELPTGVIDCTSHVMQSQLDNTKFSASVPLNMNTLCLTSQASSTVPSDQTKETECNKADEERPLNGSFAPVNYHGHQNIISLCDI